MTNENIVSILEHEADAVRHIPVTPAFDDAITLIVEHVHHRRGRLITSGMGKAGQIAMNIATTFSSTGTPAFFLHPSEAQRRNTATWASSATRTCCCSSPTRARPASWWS